MSFPSLRFNQPRGNQRQSARRALAQLSGSVNQAVSEILDAASNASSYYARVYLSGNTSFGIPGYTDVDWDAETMDVSGWHDNATNPSRITVDQTGLYNIVGQVSWDAAVVTGPINYRVQTNGGSACTLEFPGIASGSAGQCFQLVLPANSGDYFTVGIQHSSASGKTVLGGTRNTWLFVQYLGA